MDPRCSGRERDIESVVDENRHRETLHQGLRQRTQLPVARALQSQLDRTHPAADGGQADGQNIAALKGGVVGDQQETEVVG